MAILKNTTNETPVETPVETPAGFVPPEENSNPEPVAAQAPTVQEPAGEVVIASDKPLTLANLFNKITPGVFGHSANKVVAASGKLKIKPDDLVIGETMDVQVLSYNKRWSVGPAEIPRGDADAKFLFRSSYDNETLDDPELGTVTIQEYIENAIPEKYKGGEVKEYMDVIVAAIGCEENEDKFLENLMFVVQLSPSVVGKFNFFVGTMGMKAARGLVPKNLQTCIRFRGAPGPNTKFDYSIIKFETCPPEVLEGYEPMEVPEM